MSATVERMQLHENLTRAASIDTENIMVSLAQLLGYRQRVAQEILKGGYNEENQRALDEQFEYLNTNIKKVLGLYIP
jgi:hypothetical protein